MIGLGSDKKVSVRFLLIPAQSTSLWSVETTLRHPKTSLPKEGHLGPSVRHQKSSLPREGKLKIFNPPFLRNPKKWLSERSEHFEKQYPIRAERCEAGRREKPTTPPARPALAYFDKLFMRLVWRPVKPISRWSRRRSADIFFLKLEKGCQSTGQRMPMNGRRWKIRRKSKAKGKNQTDRQKMNWPGRVIDVNEMIQMKIQKKIKI